MSDNPILPPLEEGQDLSPEQGFIIPDNYDLKYTAFYAHIWGPSDELLGSAIVDKGKIIQFDPGVEHEFDGIHYDLRYGGPIEIPVDPELPVINLYPGWEITAPTTTVFSFNSRVNMIFALDGTAKLDWTTDYDNEGVEIPGSATTFVWGDGNAFPTKEYELSARVIGRWVSTNGLNYPRLTINEDEFYPIVEGFSIGIREVGWVDSRDGYIVVELTVRQTDDLAKVATGTFRVNKKGIDGGIEKPMVLTINTNLISEPAPKEL